ncbi:MAG TPA: glycosyltransferase, partial [Flavobacteriaceae bacterium]|nr:glycosyltransferase [Flavobacteriaceae bacterium]
NRNNLSKNFKVDSNKFIHCDNVQDIKNILEKLKKYVQIKSYSKNEIVLQKIKQLKNEDLYFEVIGYSDNINEATSLLFKSRKVFLNEEIRSSVVKASSFKKEGNYFFLTFLVSSEILAFETETVIHSWDVYLDSEKEYRIKCFDKLQMTFKNEHNDLIPYSTKYKNFSIMSIRKKSRKDISEYKKSIVFVLVRIDYQGGVTKVTIDLANILAENGYKVTIVAVNTIISPNSFPISDKVSFDYVSLNIHTNKDIIPGNAYSKVEIMDIIFVEKMKNYFSKLNTDFVYFPIYGSSMFINLLKFIPFNVKKIIGDHSGRRYKIYDKLLQEEKEISCQELGNLTTDYHYLNNLEKINAVHIVNPLVKPIYEQITSKPILGIPNIVSVKENLIEDTKVLNWSKRQKKIIAVGSLTKVKNFHTLIEVFHSVSMEFQDWVLEIYGEGAEKENLQTLIEKLSLTERVYLKGFSRNIIENFKNSMLHVSVSKIESFGLTMVESMSQGTLTLSTYTTIGAKYLLEDNVTGFLAKSNKQEDISVKLKEVLNLIDNSDASIFKIQENAYLKSKQFNASSISKEWDEALLKLN